MKAIDFSTDKVFVKYVDPQRPMPEEIVIQVKAANLKSILHLGNKTVITDVVGIVQHEKGNFKMGSWVAALLPIDRETILPEFLPVPLSNVALLPDNVDSFEFILTFSSVVRSYIALAAQCSAFAGQTILILDGAETDNFNLLQLASHCGCKVLTAVQNIEQEQFLQCVANVKVANVGVAAWKSLEKFVSDETSDLGADIIIDNGVSDDSKNDLNMNWKPRKYEIINSLAPCGKWLTTTPSIQLDPPETSALFGKAATIGFFNHHAWLLSNYQQGLLLQIMENAIKMISKKVVKPPSYEVISLKEIENFGTFFSQLDCVTCHVIKMA